MNREEQCDNESMHEVAEQLTQLNQELDRASELQDKINERIICVLRSEPCNESEDEKPMQELVPLASQIRACVEKMRKSSKAYEAMLSRIEL